MYSKIRKFNSDVHLFQFKPSNDLQCVLVDAGQNVKVPLSKLDNQWMLNNGYRAKAKINASFFNQDVIGWNFVDYDYVLSEGWQDGIYDLFFKDNKLIIDDVSKEKFETEYKGKAQWGTSLSYTLVQNGKINLAGSNKYSHATATNPRTMIGQKADGTIVLAVVDGRTISNRGVKAQEQAEIMLELGCVNAINCDGGGSSEMIVDGWIKNNPSDGKERAVPNGIIVYEKIKTQTPVQSEPKQEGGKDMITIVLDAGHGYNTAGKRTPDGQREWSMNSKVATYVEQKLAKYEGVQVRRVDDTTGAKDISLTERMKAVKNIMPDLFVSIHHNANTSTWGNWTGVEAYAHPLAPKVDKDLATKAAKYLSESTGLKNRGMKTADFQVLRQCPTSVPGILIEGGFMDSTIDHPVITSAAGQEKYADAIVKLIVEHFNLKRKAEEPASTKMYRVIAGSYANRDTANSIKAKLEADGYTGVWIQAIDAK